MFDVKSTSSYASKEELFSILEAKGALIDCQSTKDTFIYAASCHVNGVKDVLAVIADAVHRPLITPQEVDFYLSNSALLKSGRGGEGGGIV
ncbi:unnamed protein product [Toxocara canis]|uniref:Peptidase_M16 domain-containing protein n=1 Tax=Toxocara canis TaxID=6265 RepID=A0A183U9X0_TOXCA|nr:unnamed protein product [Toxocara canis]